MNTAKPVTPSVGNVTVRSNTAPMSSRNTAVSLFVAFFAGGLLAGALPFWAFVLVGIVLGGLALYGLERYSRGRS